MIPGSGLALFCESVRDEVSGQSTFVGVYRSALNLAKAPARLRQFCILVFMEIDPTNAPADLSIRFQFPNDDEPVMIPVPEREWGGDIPAEMEGKAEVRVRLEANYDFRGVPITRAGRIVVEAVVAEETELLGMLDVALENATDGNGATG